MIRVLLYSLRAIPISFMMIVFPLPNREYWYNKLEKITDKLLNEI